MTDQLLTIEELCSRLGIGKNTAYQLAKSIKHIKIGRRLLVSEQDLNDYLEKNMSC